MGLSENDAPLFHVDFVGRQYPPPITHPDFYYGFVGVTFAWQVAFLVIASDPIRCRPMMMAAILEKFGYVATTGARYIREQLQFGQFAPAIPDLVLELLFIAGFLKTPVERARQSKRPSLHT